MILFCLRFEFWIILYKMKYLVLCNILFTSFILCSDTTAGKSKVPNNILPDSLPPIPPNETQVPSEGGSISTDILAFPKSNNNIPSLDNEVGKSKIVARKGADNYTDDVTKSSEKPSQSIIQNSSIKPNTPVEKPNTTKEQPKITTSKPSSPKVDGILTNKTSESTSKPLPKKPLILNADLLEKSPPEVKSSPETLVHSPPEVKSSPEKLVHSPPEVKSSPETLVHSPPEVKSSPETLVHNQIQSPNKDAKSYISNVNNHPGMVMPIVITILLVPMFAVLGYMALRRGQEAWKNRHYKRMDFLLDGMYND